MQVCLPIVSGASYAATPGASACVDEFDMVPHRTSFSM